MSATRTISVELTREEIKSVAGFAQPISEETPCPCGAIQPAHGCPIEDRAKAKLRAALSQPEHQGDELAEDLRAMARDTERNLAPAEWAEPLRAAADRLTAHPPTPALSEGEREKLRALADRIASDIEEDWPHAEEMRGHIRLLRNLADQQEEAK